MKLSVIVPVYNEAATITEVVRRVLAVHVLKELVIVDDGSTDGTREFLMQLPPDEATVLFHERNLGKGAAIRTALEHVSGEIVIIQDAALEYDPNDYPALVQPMVEGTAQVVFGSRVLSATTPTRTSGSTWAGGPSPSLRISCMASISLTSRPVIRCFAGRSSRG